MNLAVIGGSGLYELGSIADQEPIHLHTPYGPHSGGLVVGEMVGRRVAFLPRHGVGHRIPPHRIPYRANIWALKELGVKRIVAVSAMGGLRPEYEIGDLVLPDQFIDWTRGRPSTFYDGPVVVHTSLADPFCPELRGLLLETARETDFQVHGQGTCLSFEGPRFSTRAESRVFREVLGADLLSMTLVPEVALARELGICYATCSVLTDLDVWGKEAVQANEVIRVMEENGPRLAKLLLRVIPRIPETQGCTCGRGTRSLFPHTEKQGSLLF